MQKNCVVCGEVFEAVNRRKVYCSNRCCKSANRKANPDHARAKAAEYSRKYRETEKAKEYEREYRKAYLERNRDRIASRKRDHREANLDRYSERDRKYYYATRDERLAYDKRYYQENRDTAQAYARERYRQKTLRTNTLMALTEGKEE